MMAMMMMMSCQQVRVQARDKHGWGGFSENFTFSTRATGDIPKELPVEVHSSGITDSGSGGQGLGLVSGSWRVDGSSSNLLVVVLILVLIGPIESSHWLRRLLEPFHCVFQMAEFQSCPCPF